MGRNKSALYLPGVGAFDYYDEIENGQFVSALMGKSLIEDSDQPKFHIGQSYAKKLATALQCKECGGKQFYVGRGYCYTVIKCPVCEWEMCIHEG
jgi:hypothetical protein